MIASGGHAFVVTTDLTLALDLRRRTAWKALPDLGWPHSLVQAPMAGWTGGGLLVAHSEAAAVFGTGSAEEGWRRVSPPPRLLSPEATLYPLSDGQQVAVDTVARAAAVFDPARSRWSAMPLETRRRAAVAAGESGAAAFFVWGGSTDANLPFGDGAMLPWESAR
ncbi:MAG: hypothetical protein ACR2MA_09455 [Egibacteraceae bacterium]